MKNNILVLGGTGFIGHNLLKKLARTKNKITSLSTGIRNKNLDLIKNVEYLSANLVDLKNLKRVLNKDYQIIINLSGNIDHKNYDQTKKIHFYSLKNLLKVINLKKLNLFIQAGSSLEYGKLNSPQREKIRCKPISLYGKAKSLSSEFLQKKIKKKVIILRLYQIYGPFQKINRIIPLAIFNLKNFKNFNSSSGTQLRDFLYVDDFVNLIKKIIQSKKIKGGIFNVGFGRATSIKSVLQKIEKKISFGKVKYGKIKMRKDEPKVLFPNTKKIKKYYNWYPTIKLDLGLKKTIKFYEKKTSFSKHSS